MHHIFVSEKIIDLTAKKVNVSKSLDLENFNHLAKSLRINVGEDVLVSPISYSINVSYKCKVENISTDSIDLSIEGKEKSNELPVKINLYQGLPKSDKLEFIIEKAVELGVYSVIPVAMTNSVVKVNDKVDKKLIRYNKISRSAAEQSKRGIIPEVKDIISFDEMIEKTSKSEKGKNILFFENAEGIEKTKGYIRDIKGLLKKPAEDNDIEINVIIGPEGGFSDKEIEKAKNKGIEILTLGDRILRTETAAITALSILMYELQF